jgi:dienelactone hydrolase
MTLAVLLAALRPFSGHFQRANLDAIADEAGSIGYMFYRDNRIPFGCRFVYGLHADSPHINGAGSRLAYCMTSEHGGGIYADDLATGESKLAFEMSASNFYIGPSACLSVHSWSPDNNRFLYCPSDLGLNIFDVTLGKTVAAFPQWSPVGVAWLNTNSFVWVDRNGADSFLHVIQEQAGDQWKELGEPVKTGFTGLTALSTNRVAWLENGRLLALDLATRKTEVVAALPGHRFFEFDHSPQTDAYLLLSTTNQGEAFYDSYIVYFLWRLEPGSTTPTLITSAPALSNARWINHGKGYAYLDQPKRLCLQEDMNAAPVRLFEPGRADSFDVSADGLHLAVTGIASNEPAFSLWQYDLAAHSLQLAVPGAEHGLTHLQPVGPQFATIPGPPKRNLHLIIYKPANFDRHKKYPLVIANTPYEGAEPYMKQYALAVANAGAYFLIMDRRAWYDEYGFGAAWSDNEYCVIHYFDKEPTIDRNRIHLVSNCMESNFLTDFAAKHPGEASRAIMLIANGLPDPANFAAGDSAPKLLISTCDAWEGKSDRMQKYQQTAAQSGVEVTCVIHRNTLHDFVSKESQRDRIRAMLHLIFDP